jgi:hypothetical protein
VRRGMLWTSWWPAGYSGSGRRLVKRSRCGIGKVDDRIREETCQR